MKLSNKKLSSEFTATLIKIGVLHRRKFDANIKVKGLNDEQVRLFRILKIDNIIDFE